MEWLRTSGIDGKQPHAHEHFILTTALRYLGSVDQVNLPELPGVEVLVRRAQLIESAFELSKDGKTPDFFHGEEMMGLYGR
eukprot:2998732-Alexandrium_andersonii.AAC.1